jgi:hypothetical protein
MTMAMTMTFFEYIAIMKQKGIMPTVVNYFETIDFLNRHELLHKFMNVWGNKISIDEWW